MSMIEPMSDPRYDDESPVKRQGRRERSWERVDREEAEQYRRLMSLLNQQAASLGGILDLMQAPPMNDVLATISATCPANGLSTWNWKQPFASVAFANTSANELVLVGAAPSPNGQAPGRSAGVIFIPSGYFRVVSLRSTALTVYNSAGSASNFDFTAYIRPQQPMAGPCGVG